MEFELNWNLNDETVREIIQGCQKEDHIQQVAFSTYHNCLTQICFGCKRIRTSMKEIDVPSTICECKHSKWEHTFKDKASRCMYGNGRNCLCQGFKHPIVEDTKNEVTVPNTVNCTVKGCQKPFQKVYKENSKYPEDYLICGFTKIGDKIQYCKKCKEDTKSKLKYPCWANPEAICKYCGKKKKDHYGTLCFCYEGDKEGLQGKFIEDRQDEPKGINWIKKQIREFENEYEAQSNSDRRLFIDGKLTILKLWLADKEGLFNFPIQEKNQLNKPGGKNEEN